MSEQFKREPRYVVFKITDLLAFCEMDLGTLDRLGHQITNGRAGVGKPPFNAVVVEQDWPEFDLVWSMIEARMTGVGNDSSRLIACVNACSEIADPINCIPSLLRGNQRLLTIEQQRDSLLRQRDELLAALERLSFAAARRDNTIGDQCNLIEVKAELAAANRQAMSAIEGAKREHETMPTLDRVKLPGHDVAFKRGESEGGEA